MLSHSFQQTLRNHQLIKIKMKLFLLILLMMMFFIFSETFDLTWGQKLLAIVLKLFRGYNYSKPRYRTKYIEKIVLLQCYANFSRLIWSTMARSLPKPTVPNGPSLFKIMFIMLRIFQWGWVFNLMYSNLHHFIFAVNVEYDLNKSEYM